MALKFGLGVLSALSVALGKPFGVKGSPGDIISDLLLNRMWISETSQEVSTYLSSRLTVKGTRDTDVEVLEVEDDIVPHYVAS